ncbi:MAG: transposase [Candidatus Omnitrophica bacterium]|nr:transposase [Candidatus Omnitrophota bacterium]
MARKPRIYLKGFCYHIVLRGNQQQFTFHTDEDFEKFLSITRKYKLKYENKIFAYCVMGNHFHLLLDPFNAKALIGFMHGVNMSYAQYYNYRYNKCGHLWQDRYKNHVITKNSYIYNCINYIEYNPVRAKIVDKPEDYKWSSYRGRNGFANDILLDEIVL